MLFEFIKQLFRKKSQYIEDTIVASSPMDIIQYIRNYATRNHCTVRMYGINIALNQYPCNVTIAIKINTDGNSCQVVVNKEV